MTDIPSNEVIERVLREEPNLLLDKLPDCDDTRAAREFLRSAETLAHRAREQAPPDLPA